MRMRNARCRKTRVSQWTCSALKLRTEVLVGSCPRYFSKDVPLPILVPNRDVVGRLVDINSDAGLVFQLLINCFVPRSIPPFPFRPVRPAGP
jgi:hypothetical protein